MHVYSRKFQLGQFLNHYVKYIYIKMNGNQISENKSEIISNGMVSYFIIWLLVKNILGRNNPRHCLIQRKINSGEAGQCISHVKYICSLHVICTHMHGVHYISLTLHCK